MLLKQDKKVNELNDSIRSLKINIKTNLLCDYINIIAILEPFSAKQPAHFTLAFLYYLTLKEV